MGETISTAISVIFIFETRDWVSVIMLQSSTNTLPRQQADTQKNPYYCR